MTISHAFGHCGGPCHVMLMMIEARWGVIAMYVRCRYGVCKARRVLVPGSPEVMAGVDEGCIVRLLGISSHLMRRS